MTKKQTFTDVSASRWSYEDIEFAVRMGFFKGFADGTFRPTESVTREQLCAILRRTLVYPWGAIVNMAEKATVKLTRGHSHGTGAILSGSYVLTASHVAGGADMLQVNTKSGLSYTAAVLAKHPTVDLAILQLQTSDTLPCLFLTDEQDIRSTEEVLVIGHPHNEAWKATSGKVSREQVGGQPWEFEIRCEVRPGNSGGPVLNQQGELIGIVVQQTKDDLGEAVDLTHFREWICSYIPKTLV